MTSMERMVWEAAHLISLIEATVITVTDISREELDILSKTTLTLDLASCSRIPRKCFENSLDLILLPTSLGELVITVLMPIIIRIIPLIHRLIGGITPLLEVIIPTEVMDTLIPQQPLSTGGMKIPSSLPSVLFRALVASEVLGDLVVLPTCLTTELHLLPSAVVSEEMAWLRVLRLLPLMLEESRRLPPPRDS